LAEEALRAWKKARANRTQAPNKNHKILLPSRIPLRSHQSASCLSCLRKSGFVTLAQSRYAAECDNGRAMDRRELTIGSGCRRRHI
jgi:hypothetical protein